MLELSQISAPRFLWDLSFFWFPLFQGWSWTAEAGLFGEGRGYGRTRRQAEGVGLPLMDGDDLVALWVTEICFQWPCNRIQLIGGTINIRPIFEAYVREYPHWCFKNIKELKHQKAWVWDRTASAFDSPTLLRPHGAHADLRYAKPRWPLYLDVVGQLCDENGTVPSDVGFPPETRKCVNKESRHQLTMWCDDVPSHPRM